MTQANQHRSLPPNPSPNTRLLLKRLEAAGYKSLQELSHSDWETIQRFEAIKPSPFPARVRR